jgi:hypothetical protein
MLINHTVIIDYEVKLQCLDWQNLLHSSKAVCAKSKQPRKSLFSGKVIIAINLGYRRGLSQDGPKRIWLARVKLTISQ